MKSRLILSLAVVVVANTASAAGKTTSKVRGIRKRRNLEVDTFLATKDDKKTKKDCTESKTNRRRTKKCKEENPETDKEAAWNQAPDGADAPNEADFEAFGSAEGFEEDTTRIENNDQDLTELNVRETSSGNKFFTQESSIAVGAILATGLGLL
mmetsp:Transcript_21181/g.29952  ORF Transcript_21181/g.29952 Transcript_21181/m.29952 type:complete len:154 (+) Transcript_21181:112-573(+)